MYASGGYATIAYICLALIGWRDAAFHVLLLGSEGCAAIECLHPCTDVYTLTQCSDEGTGRTGLEGCSSVTPIAFCHVLSVEVGAVQPWCTYSDTMEVGAVQPCCTYSDRMKGWIKQDIEKGCL